MRRRNTWLRLGLILALVLVPILGISQTLTDNGSTTPDHITLTWTDNPANTMTLTWRTDTTIMNGYIQYQKGYGINQKADIVKAHYSVFTSNIGISHIFTKTLSELSPNSRYTYRVGGYPEWSPFHTFKTANRNASSVKFLIFGDSQSSDKGEKPYGVWHNTLNNAVNANPDAEFFVNVGDLSDIGQSGTHWNAWFKASEGVVDRLPIMPVQGNHETYGDPSNHKPVYYLSQFTLSENGPAGLKEQAYSYDMGPVHIVVLDSQADEEGDILPAQKTWLESDLAASKAPWKIAFFHKPPYEVHNVRANLNVKKAFCPVFDKYHVDMVFNAHDHGVARTYPINDGKYMQKPSEGTIYYVVGRSGTKVYKDIGKKDWDTYFFAPQSQPNYLVFKADKNRLSVKSFNQDGTLLDDFFIDKKKDISSDSIK